MKKTRDITLGGDFATSQKKIEEMTEMNRKDCTVAAAQSKGADNTHAKRCHKNLINKYINKIYRLCLLNLLAAMTFLFIYRKTGNELLVPAIYACVANGLLAYCSI